MLFVGPDGEQVEEPFEFEKEWKLHVYGQNYYW
jgi:hypothetical protein